MNESRLKINFYKTMLCSLNVAQYHGEIIVAKPIMLLAIFRLIEGGMILGNRISFAPDLIELYFKLYEEYVPQRKITPPEYPFYYLDTEEFFYIKGNTSRKTPSAKFIRDNIEYASFDDQLWDMLQDKAIRDEYREAIINFYLKKH